MAGRSPAIPTRIPLSPFWPSPGGLPTTSSTRPRKETSDMGSTRREVLYQIALSVGAGAVPVSAQQGAAPHDDDKTPPAASRSIKVFNQHEFKTLQALSNWIIPPDERSKGGIQAGTAEFIDVMAASDEKLK